MSDEMTRDELLALMRAWGWTPADGLGYQVWFSPRMVRGVPADEAIVPGEDWDPGIYDRYLARAIDTLARAEAPRLLAVVREVEGLHRAEPGVSNGAACNICRECLKVWPCPTCRALQALTESKERNHEV